MNRAIETTRFLEANKIKVVNAAALLDRRDKAAFILDFDCRLQDANAAFDQLAAPLFFVSGGKWKGLLVRIGQGSDICSLGQANCLSCACTKVTDDCA